MQNTDFNYEGENEKVIYGTSSSEWIIVEIQNHFKSRGRRKSMIEYEENESGDIVKNVTKLGSKPLYVSRRLVGGRFRDEMFTEVYSHALKGVKLSEAFTRNSVFKVK